MVRALRRLFMICLALLGSVTLFASDLIEVIPLTPKVIALHFSDGTALYRGYHSEKGDTRIFNDPLDIQRAVHPYAYNIISQDDSNYDSGLNPLRLGRKSKPTAISDSCVWKAAQQLCDNEYVLDHWIYMELPHALEKNRTYTIWLGSLAGNLDELTFEYNEASMRSELIHVNQHGYTPDARMKYAYLAHWAGDFGPLDLDFLEGNSFSLVNVADQSVAYQGTVTSKRRDLDDAQQDFGSPDTWGTSNNVYGSDVWEVDFSEFSTPGDYLLVVEGVGCSFPFSIDAHVYREAYYYTTRGLYYQRAGIEKEEAFAGKWAQPRDHHPEDGIMKLYHTTYPSVLTAEGGNSKDSILANVVGEITDWGWGWYHDAGDWDAYVHHTEVPFFLLATYEMAPQNFGDNELNIPESGNGIPDILDEAAWLINYFRRNQQANGGIAGGRANSDFNKKPDASPSYEDTRPWYVSGEDPHTSYLFAGLVTQYAYCLELAGITDSTSMLLAEARAAYQWAGANLVIAPEVKVKGATLADLKMYAAANLFKLSGETVYQDDFLAMNRVTSAVTSLSGGDYNQTKAVWSYITAPDHPGIDAALKSLLSEATIKYAINDFVDPAKKRSGRMGYSWNRPAVVGSTTTPVNIAPMYASHVATGAQKQEFIDYMQTTADFFLGNNPLNTSWITGLGDRHPERLLHLDSRYDINDLDEYVPGLVPYGPLRHGDHFKGEDADGPHDADFAKIRSYPDRYKWPVSEFWFDNPYSVLDGEFTVHQTNAPAASAYGFLAGDASLPFAPNQAPEISILSPAGASDFDESETLKVEVSVSDDVGVAYVMYFLDHHPVAKEMQAPFHTELAVKDLPSGTYTLKARVVDGDGMETWTKGPAVSISHAYQPAILISPDTDSLTQGQALDVLVDVTGIQDVSVVGVKLILNGSEVGSSDTAPFQFTIDSIPPMYNEIKAVLSFSEGFESSAKIEKYARPGVAGVTFKKKELALHAGEYEILEYEIFPAEAENRAVVFFSGDDQVASVSDQGQVGGLEEGETIVVISTVDGGFTDTTHVMVLPPRPEGPFGGEPAILPVLIEAENFDYGGEGRAYHDETPGNSEGIYRFEDVDVGSTYDEGPAYHVTGNKPGEWLNYTVYAPESNLYDIRFRYTAGSGEPSVTLKSDGEEIGTYSLPEVGWYPFMDHVVEDIPLREGLQVLSLVFNNGLMTLNHFEVLCEECNTILPQDINLNYHDLDVAVGGKIQLVGSLMPATSTNKTVLWTTPGDGVVFVDPNGMLTALRVGSTKVIATSEARGLSDTCRVEVLEGSAFSPGVNYEYFQGEWDLTPDFASMTPVFSGNISNFDISPATDEDFFGFRFYGEISIFQSGTYSFYTASDDGSLLYLDGALLVDNDGLHATVEQGGMIELDSGRHQIEVLFFEKGGGADLQVSYEGPEIPKGPVPDSILGTYVEGGELVALAGFTMPGSMQLPLDAKRRVPVVFLPEDASDREMTFTSSDPTVVSIDAYGRLHGLSTGTSNIGGTSREGSFTGTSLVTVVNDTPLVTITSPEQGEVFNDTTSIRISFTVTDTIGGVTSIMLYIDNELIQSAQYPADGFELGQLAEGAYELLIQAEDRHGLAGQSEILSITVEELVTVTAQASLDTEMITALPNPFSDKIKFRIILAEGGDLSMKVYDLSGALHHISGPHYLKAGVSSIEWDGSGAENQVLEAGAYICKFSLEQAGSQKLFQKMIIKQ